MKTVLIFLIGFLSATVMMAQDWESFPFDTPYSITSHYYDSTTQVLYLGGHYKYLGGVEVNAIGSWDGQQIDSLDGGQDGCNYFNCPTIKAMTMYDEKLHVEIPTLHVNELQQVNSIGVWENEEWVSIDSGIPEGGIFHMREYQEDLYVMGRWAHSFQDSIYGIIKWDKEKWASVDFPYFAYTGDIITIYSSTILNNDLYVGGNFRNADASVHDVARFDGENWYPVGNAVNGGADDVYAITSYQGDIYIGGDFRSGSGNAGNKIMKLENDVWVDVAGGIDGFYDIVLDMKVFDDKLYVFGRFKSVGGGIPANCIAVWDGEKWCGVATGLGISKVITQVSMMENDILVIGEFDEIGGIPAHRIALWKNWKQVDTCGETTSSNYLPPDEFQFNIQPNPVQKVLNIVIENKNGLDDFQLSVFNLLGQSLYHSPLLNFEKNWTHDVSAYPSGTYFLTLQSGEKIVTKKFVVQR